MTNHGQRQQQLTVVIAGYVIVLKTTDDAVAEKIRSRYAEFLGPTENPHFTITLKITAGALFIPIEPGPWIIESSFDDNWLRYCSYLERGEVDLRTGQGHLEMAPNATVENFLRVAYSWLCLQDNGLLLHAAGVIRDEAGYVFFGPSGAGKTTTSRLAARTAAVLSDDLVIIRRHEGNGHKSGYHLYGVPFKGEMSDAPRINNHAPLKGIFRLRQDTSHRLRSLPHGMAVAELVAASPFVVRELSLSSQLISVCDQIARETPIRALHFKRDDGFWQVIDEFYALDSETTSSDSR